MQVYLPEVCLNEDCSAEECPPKIGFAEVGPPEVGSPGKGPPSDVSPPRLGPAEPGLREVCPPKECLAEQRDPDAFLRSAPLSLALLRSMISSSPSTRHLFHASTPFLSLCRCFALSIVSTSHI